MNRCLAGVLIAAVLVSVGCGGGANSSSDVASNAAIIEKVEKVVAASPNRSLLVGLETKAIEAWKSGDMAFWDTFLDASYVGFNQGKRLDKAGEIKLITDGKCEIGSYSFSDESMVPIGNDAIVLTLKATSERKCGGQTLPSPVTASTLFVRSGDTWKAAYHNETAIIAPAAAKTAKPAAPKKAEPTASEPQKTDALSEELFAIEKKVWEAWKSGNRTAMESLLTDDVSLVGSNGTVTIGKKAVVDAWILPKCDIKAAAPSEGIATEISPIVGILTFKGNATGTCEGQPLESFWGTSIFQKESGEWKIAFTFETPA